MIESSWVIEIGWLSIFSGLKVEFSPWHQFQFSSEHIYLRENNKAFGQTDCIKNLREKQVFEWLNWANFVWYYQSNLQILLRTINLFVFLDSDFPNLRVWNDLLKSVISTWLWNYNFYIKLYSIDLFTYYGWLNYCHFEWKRLITALLLL